MRSGIGTLLSLNDLHACIQPSKPALPGDPIILLSLFTHQLASCHPGSRSRLILTSLGVVFASDGRVLLWLVRNGWWRLKKGGCGLIAIQFHLECSLPLS